MKKILIAVDLQNDFIDGALGTKEAETIVPAAAARIREYRKEGAEIIATLDTHGEDYMQTREGKYLPVPHCIKGTDGWQIRPELDVLRKTEPLDKVTFGSSELGPILKTMNEEEPIGTITLIGLCTDICVISNAMIAKAFLPEVPVIVDAKCCAGVTPETHENALAAMRCCQIQIVH
jgi:nicotinamidase-related amidase